MKVTVYTLTTDDGDRTSCQVFGTESARDEALLDWAGTTQGEFEKYSDIHEDNFHEFIQTKIDSLDTFSTDEIEVSVPNDTISTGEAWAVLRSIPGFIGAHWLPEEISQGLEHEFDMENDFDRAALLAWCDINRDQIEEDMLIVLASKKVTREDIYLALAEKETP